MVDINTEISEAEQVQASKKAAAKKKKRKKLVKSIITLVIVLAVLAGIGFGMLMLFREKPVEQQVLTDFVMRGSIVSSVTGSGITKAKDAASIAPPSTGGIVLEVFVADGDVVEAGDPLYTMDDSEARAAVEAQQKIVDGINKQIADINKAYAELSVTAPFSGTLVETTPLEEGAPVSSGTKLAKIVDDSKLNLSLYFSYAYENDISIGMAGGVSIPSLMSEISGSVSEINYINRISSEGARLFNVVITMDNPGTLTAGMGASAILHGASGEDIYPYSPGNTEYFRTKDIVAKASGEAMQKSYIDYTRVSEGQIVMQLSADSNDDEMEKRNTELSAAMEKLKQLEESMNNLNAVSPMNGTVLSCSLIAGEKVEAGNAVSIADTSVMMVEARIDEMNVSYVKPGMYCDITTWGRNGQEMFMGTVESVSLEGKNENGMSFFPAVIRVDNPEGSIMSGMYVDYTLIASQSDDCLVVPVQAVKYTEAGTCLFVKRDERPENAVDSEGMEIPDGFYALPVTIGLSNNYQAEIIDGAEEGDEIFTQFIVTSGDSWSGGGRVMMG